MKILLTLSFAFLGLYASVQTYTDTTDPFTGKQNKAAVVLFGKSIYKPGIGLSLVEKDQKKYLVFFWPTAASKYGTFDNVKPGSASILLKMQNDSIYRFKGDTISPQNLNYGNTNALVIISEVSDAKLLILVEHKIAIFRIAFNGGSDGVDLDNRYIFTNKNKEEVQKMAAHSLGLTVFEGDVPESQ